MNNKDELQKLIEKEKEYNDLFEDFVSSDDERKFDKQEVEKIVEAHLFKEFIARYRSTKSEKQTRKNILVTSKEIGAKFLDPRFILNFALSYLFYVGFLVLITAFIYPNLLSNKMTVFIIAFVFTLFDKLIKPFIFFADLISFTFHKIGLITLSIYSLIFFIVSITLGEAVPFEKSIIVAVLVLLMTLTIEFIKKDSMVKTKLLDHLEETGSEHDE